MSESMVSHKGPANEPKARANVHVPRLKSPRLSRPYFSDWVLQHQIGVSLFRFLNVVVYLLNFYSDRVNSDLGGSLTTHLPLPVPSLHTEILATILRLTAGPNIQAGLR